VRTPSGEALKVVHCSDTNAILPGRHPARSEAGCRHGRQ
jgi:hypothetical protein